MPSCCMLQNLACQAMREDLQCTRVFENDACACRLDCSSGMHGNGCAAPLDTLGKVCGKVPLVLARKQDVEVLYEPIVWRTGRPESSSARLAGGRQLDS